MDQGRGEREKKRVGEREKRGRERLMERSVRGVGECESEKEAHKKAYHHRPNLLSQIAEKSFLLWNFSFVRSQRIRAL